MVSPRASLIMVISRAISSFIVPKLVEREKLPAGKSDMGRSTHHFGQTVLQLKDADLVDKTFPKAVL